MRTKIEVDEMGRFILLLPDEIIEEYGLDEGDLVPYEMLEDGVLILDFHS